MTRRSPPPPPVLCQLTEPFPPSLSFLPTPPPAPHHDLTSTFLVRIPLQIPAVGTSETVSPATCVIPRADSYVTFVCEQPKAKIIYEKVLA